MSSATPTTAPADPSTRFSAELFERAGDLGIPTLLLRGADDHVTPIDALDTARSLVKPQESHVIDCGHMAPYERPREVAERIASFTASRTERHTS